MAEDVPQKRVKKSKNQLRREKAKLSKTSEVKENGVENGVHNSPPPPDVDTAIEHQPAPLRPAETESSQIATTDVNELLDDPRFSQYKSILDKFYTQEVSLK